MTELLGNGSITALLTRHISRIHLISLLLFAAFAFAVSIDTAAQVTFSGTQMNIAGNALASPRSVTVDGKGNLYVADQGNNRIVHITKSSNVDSSSQAGSVETVLAGLSSPGGVAADWGGNIYVADTGNNQVLMLLLKDGKLALPIVIGSGFNAPIGLAVDSNANVYVADTGNNQVIELPRLGNGYGSPLLVIGGLNNPTGIAVDASKALYIADTGNSRVLKLPYTPAGYVSQQAIGRGLVSPLGVAVDASYNLYIADTGNNRIVEEPWFAGARRYNSQLIVGSNEDSPAGVARDSAGNVYVTDLGNSQLVEVVTGSVTLGAFNVGSAGSKQTYNFNIAAGTAIGSVSVYMQGVLGRDFSDSGGTTCTPQTYDSPTACGVNVSFTPLESGIRTGSVVISDPQGNLLASTFIAGYGLLERTAYLPGTRTVISTQLSGPAGITVDGNGNVFIADTGNNRVLEVPNSNGVYGQQVEVPLTGLNSPMGLAIDGAGNLYVVSNGNDKVIKLPWMGDGFGLQTKVGAGFYGPTGTAVDSGGNVYVADTLDQFVFRLPWSGSSFLQAQHLGGYVKCPLGVTVDGRGDVFFTMPYQNALVEVALVAGQYQPQVLLPLSRVSFPSALAVDGNSNLYILDTGNNRVVMLPWNGTSYGEQLTVASGFNAPGALAVDSDGNLYIADTGNNQIVKIDMSAPQSMTFADTYLGSTSVDSAQVLSIANTGNLPLSFSSIAFPADFPADGNNANPCLESVAIPAGGICQLAIDFAPAVTGEPLNEALAISTDTLGRQQFVSLTGRSSGRVEQTILFPPIPDFSYGVTNVPLSATVSSSLPLTYQVLSGPATLTQNRNSLTITGAGLVIVQAMQAGNATYAPAASEICTFQVLPALLTVTAANVKSVYGATTPAFSYTVSGFVAGQNARQVVSGTATVTTDAGTSSPAGTYTLTVSQGTLAAANYKLSFVSGTLTIQKATLFVRAVSTSATYGQPPPAMAWAFSGFVNGDSPAVVSGTPAMLTTAVANATVGTYSITPSLGTLSAINYLFSFVGAALSISPAVLTVTANDQSFIRGNVVPTLTYTISGFVDGDSMATSVNGIPSLMTAANAKSDVGTYPSVITNGTMIARNYRIHCVPGVITVMPAVLTITPADAAMTYGGIVPALGFVATGWVNGEKQPGQLTGTPTLNTTATSATRPGSAVITAAIGSLNSKNYTFSFGTGHLTISKALLMVHARSASITYGERLPTFPFSMTGFLNGDTNLTVSGYPSWSVAATTTPSVGSYAITGDIGSLTSTSYTFQVIGDTLTVIRAPLHVVPDSVSIVYGATLPTLTYSLQGFVNGDNRTVVKGSPSLTTPTAARAPVGLYPVIASVGSLTSQNYSFVTESSTITVTRAVLTVAADDLLMVYGAALPSISCHMLGFVNGDSDTAVSGRPSFTTAASPHAQVGRYPVSVSVGSLTAANYSFVMGNSAVTIQKAVLRIVSSTTSIVYGASLPALTYNVSGFVNGDNEAVVSGHPSLSTAASQHAHVGAYPIIVAIGSLTATNYSFVAENSIVTVKKALVTVVPDTVSMRYGTAVPAFTYKLTGLVNGDKVSSVSGAPHFRTSVNPTSQVGQYVIHVDAGNLSAADYTFAFADSILGVTPAVLNVLPNATMMSYGAAVPKITYTISGFLNGDTRQVVSGLPSFQTAATSTSAIGAYNVQGNLGTLASKNYSFQVLVGRLTICRAVLTVTPASVSIVYGEAIPKLAFTIGGFFNGEGVDIVKGSARVTTTASSKSQADSYPIIVQLDHLSAPNYSFAAGSGVLMINKAVLRVTAADASMTYGGNLPASGATFAGFVNGDTAASALTGEAKIETVASGSPIGTYPTKAALGSLASVNYKFEFRSGTLTVNPAPLTVTADNLSMKAGDVLPTLTYSVTGMVNGERATQALKGKAVLTTTAAKASPAGSYPINMAAGTLHSANYTFTLVDATLTVN